MHTPYHRPAPAEFPTANNHLALMPVMQTDTVGADPAPVQCKANTNWYEKGTVGMNNRRPMH